MTSINSSSLTLFSPAKINLFLKIAGRREDGYHSIASLFQAIDLGDTLHFSIDKGAIEPDTLTCTSPEVPVDSSNLILRASDLFRKRSGKMYSLRVDLEKEIPPCAGLGGGSGNAATTLFALNTLFGEPYSREELMSWAGEIGSDEPFFLSEGTAYCTKKGDEVRLLPPLPEELSGRSITVVKPEKGLSTPLVYGALNLQELKKSDPEQALLDFYSGSPNFFNDLESAAYKVFPELGELKKTLLSAGFSDVLLCGSGSALFCIGEGKVPDMKGIRSWSCSMLNRSAGEWFVKKSKKLATV